MKQLGYNVSRNPFSSVVVKSGVCFLLLGLAYRLFSSSFGLFSPPIVDDNEPGLNAGEIFSSHEAEPPEIADDLSGNLDIYTGLQNESCNLFIGDWVQDPNGPTYTNATCSTIDSAQNCIMNGRPDSDYLYWRWNPRDCSLPKFDPKIFLHIMKHKSLAFIGDSIMRNHVQSLLCVLSQAEQSVEVYHDSAYKSKRWLFPSHNFTVSVVWSPFLAKAITFEDDNGVSSGLIQLHLDELDTVWTQQYHNFDYIIIAGGKWYLKSAVYYENNTIIGCHNCHDENITQVGFKYSYREVLNSAFKFITGSNHKPYILFRTITPDHFESGEWSSGGYCNRTKPFKEGDIEISDVDQILRDIELEEFKSAEALGSENGTVLKLFDTMLLSLMRPDGHPGVYRQFHPYADTKIQNDCLHWCLPGPIDSWNDLIMEMLLRRSS